MRWLVLRVCVLACLMVSASMAGAQDINLLPKYGQLPKNDAMKTADKVFVAGMDEDYGGDRTKASDAMAGRGWQCLAQADPETAMRRFNQAWLLKANNGTALWGMAAVEMSQGHTESSLSLFAEAEMFVGENIRFESDYARALGMAGSERKDGALLDKAYKRFELMYQKEPQNVYNLQNWAKTMFAEGRYADAWKKVKLAEVAGADRLDQGFVERLQKRMPRP